MIQIFPQTLVEGLLEARVTVRGVPELSQQPVPDPVGLPEAYSEAGHKGQEAGESAGRPHPYFAPPDLARLSPPRVLGDRLGARYSLCLIIDLTSAIRFRRGSSGSGALRHPAWPRNLLVVRQESTGDSRSSLLLHTSSPPPPALLCVTGNFQLFRSPTSSFAP